jgi:hypothetical protein
MALVPDNYLGFFGALPMQARSPCKQHASITDRMGQPSKPPAPGGKSWTPAAPTACRVTGVAIVR